MIRPGCDCGTWDHRHEPRCSGGDYNPDAIDPLQDPVERWDEASR